MIFPGFPDHSYFSNDYGAILENMRLCGKVIDAILILIELSSRYTIPLTKYPFGIGWNYYDWSKMKFVIKINLIPVLVKALMSFHLGVPQQQYMRITALGGGV